MCHDSALPEPLYFLPTPHPLSTHYWCACGGVNNVINTQNKPSVEVLLPLIPHM